MPLYCPFYVFWVTIGKNEHNFVFKSIQTWNEMLKKILVEIEPNEMGIMVPGSIKNSDLTAAIGFIKNKLKNLLIASQNCGDVIAW